MPQPNQGSPAPSANVSAPIEDKSGAQSFPTIIPPIHTAGVKGK